MTPDLTLQLQGHFIVENWRSLPISWATLEFSLVGHCYIVGDTVSHAGNVTGADLIFAQAKIRKHY